MTTRSSFIKYLRIFKAFLRASFIADLEFRLNFLTRVLIDVIWYGAQIVTYETLFLHTEKIGDWNLPQMRVFLGVVFVVDAFYMIIFHDNLDRMSYLIRKGELDLLLAKPINSQFILSCQRISTALVGNLMIAIAWLSFALWSYPDFRIERFLLFLILVPSGLMCVYSLRFFFSATAAIFTQADSLVYLWYQIYRLAIRPDSIYVPWLRFIILTVIPIGFIASVPSRMILDDVNPLLAVWALLWTGVLLFVTQLYWKKCLRNYTSASS